MKDYIKFLQENPLIYLATNGLDGNAKLRPIYFYFEENDKPYFATANTKIMYKELTSNPKCEIVVSTPEFQWLRITGKVEFVDDIDLKQRIIDSNEVVESIYKTGDNPIFEAFTVSGKATLADLSGEPAKTYEL